MSVASFTDNTLTELCNIVEVLVVGVMKVIWTTYNCVICIFLHSADSKTHFIYYLCIS